MKSKKHEIATILTLSVILMQTLSFSVSATSVEDIVQQTRKTIPTEFYSNPDADPDAADILHEIVSYSAYYRLAGFAVTCSNIDALKESVLADHEFTYTDGYWYGSLTFVTDSTERNRLNQWKDQSTLLLQPYSGYLEYYGKYYNYMHEQWTYEDNHGFIPASEQVYLIQAKNNHDPALIQAIMNSDQFEFIGLIYEREIQKYVPCTYANSMYIQINADATLTEADILDIADLTSDYYQVVSPVQGVYKIYPSNSDTNSNVIEYRIREMLTACNKFRENDNIKDAYINGIRIADYDTETMALPILLSVSDLNATAIGDIDENNLVNATDAQLVLENAAELLVENPNAVPLSGADIDGDGVVTAADAQIILNYFLNNTVLDKPTDWTDLF